MLFCTGLLFLATQRPGAHWNLGGQSRSDGVQNIRAVMGRGRARLGTSCQIIPFCWTQTCSVTSRFGVTALRPLHASMEAPPCRLGCEESPSPQLHLVQALLWCLPASFTLALQLSTKPGSAPWTEERAKGAKFHLLGSDPSHGSWRLKSPQVGRGVGGEWRGVVWRVAHQWFHRAQYFCVLSCISLTESLLTS